MPRWSSELRLSFISSETLWNEGSEFGQKYQILVSRGEFVCDLGLIGLLLFLLCNFIEGKIHNGILTAWTQGSLNREKKTQIKSFRAWK